MRLIIWMTACIFSIQAIGETREERIEQHLHADNPEYKKKGKREIHQGLEDFEDKHEYLVIFKSEEGRRKREKEKRAEAKGAPRKGNRGKSNSVRNTYYQQIADLLPAGTIFRVQSVYDTENGDIEVRLKTKAKLEYESIRHPKLLSFKPKVNITISPENVISRNYH